MQDTERQRALDQVMATVFLHSSSAFLSSIMLSLRFEWDDKIETACTNGIELRWNPKFFDSISHKARTHVLEHELWHVGLLHPVRIGSRDPLTWNYACDYLINGRMKKDNKDFDKIPVLQSDAYDYDLMTEEDIYDLLPSMPPGFFPFGSKNGEGADMLPLDASQQSEVVQTVVRAVQTAKLANQAGSIPGSIQETINKFLDPIIPWEQLLFRFFTDMLEEDHSWRKPSRRYSDMYLPSRFLDDGRLDHLMFVEDVSGSISNSDLIRFNSEVKYIKEALNPRLLTLVQFDTKIQSVKEIPEDQPFTEVVICGRGGTSLVPVRKLINKKRPTAVVVFSDLECDPMDPLEHDIPVIWVVINNRNERPPFGEFIHINN